MKKNILFIGGSSGIGLETIKLLHEKYNLIIACRTNENLVNLNVKHLKFDVLNDELDLNEIPEILDGFVYCPGSINLRPFRGLKINTFQDDLNINFLSMVKILQLVLNNLKKSESSSVVLYSTVAVKMGMPFHSSISASKGAIEGFAKSLAAEFAPDIRVNVIAPSLTDTPLASRFLNNDLKKEKVGHRHPLKRHGKAIDIANSTAFLLSEESSWLTGQILGVDGGLSTLNTSN
jgi:NAD(P)-dependent dehydrogenase (short-subunit alcohol dehydrogenase family)